MKGLKEIGFQCSFWFINMAHHVTSWSWAVLVGRDCIILSILFLSCSLHMFSNILDLSSHLEWGRGITAGGVCLVTSYINAGVIFMNLLFSGLSTLWITNLPHPYWGPTVPNCFFLVFHFLCVFGVIQVDTCLDFFILSKPQLFVSLVFSSLS